MLPSSCTQLYKYINVPVIKITRKKIRPFWRRLFIGPNAATPGGCTGG
jgi:hypothetical protein